MCAICPVTGDYEDGKPEWGFLFPAFKERSEDWNFIDVFHFNENNICKEMLDWLGVK